MLLLLLVLEKCGSVTFCCVCATDTAYVMLVVGVETDDS